MKRLLEQLNSIEAIVDTVSPAQIEQNPQGVASRYELYASSYDPIDRVKTLRERLIAEIGRGKPVNGYLSADYGYGKTATLVYLWHECQQQRIVAVPPFKFKELRNLMIASYGWIKYCLLEESELITQVEAVYRKYGLQTQQEQAAEIARKYKVSEDKALKIIQELNTDTTNTDTVLNFWQDSVPILQKAGMKGLVIFADESQEFLRTEEGSSARIQILSDLVKGMRALGNTPVALILSMPTTPTESAIEEQAGDIIHRMKEQKVYLRLADAYNYEFPGKLWDYLCAKFLDNQTEGSKLAHPATIESLAQLCDRKDLSNGPRAVIEVFKRLVNFVGDKERPYTPLDLIEDYLSGRVQFYGAQQHKINNAIDTLEQLKTIQQHPQGREVIKLLAIFPAGVSETIAKEFKLLKSLKELAENENMYGLHIIQPTEHSFALVSLSKPTTPTVVDKIINRFRQLWFGEWNDAQKEKVATTVFRAEITPLLFPVSKAGQKANWNWRYKDEWQQDRPGFYNFLSGAPERYYTEFPNRSLAITIGNKSSELMKFFPPEETHLDWRFHLSYDRDAGLQKLTAIAGTGQVDFHIHLSRSFEQEYPKNFGLLSKVIPPGQCSACTLLNLSNYIQDWLLKNPEVSKAERSMLEHHRKDCHQYGMRLLFPAIESETWIVEGIKGVNGAENKLIQSVFYQKCKALFPEYNSFYSNLRPFLLKYKASLEKLPLAVRRGRHLYQLTKEGLEKLFEVTGSGLPSVLGILKQHNLISEYKIASNKQENSQLKFAEHPLEIFIQKQLESRGRTQTIETIQGQQEVKFLDALDLWEEVKRLGYLQEEFEEAIAWLQMRRYVEWERQEGIIRTCLAELDSEELKGQLNELITKVDVLLEAFNETVLHEIKKGINEAQESIFSLADTSAQGLDAVQQSYLSEVVLDQVYRTIQVALERIETYRREKRSELQKNLLEIKLQLKNLTRDLNASKISQPIIGTSNLEDCLNDYRKDLERQVYQLDRDCQNLADSIVVDELDILALHRQIEQCNQPLKIYESNKRKLQPLVEGLSKWRIIITRAGDLRDNLLANDPERSQRYEDEFVDRVVEYFHTKEIEGFKEYELLQGSLVEIEEQIKSERRSRREAFEQLVSRYEELLGRIPLAERSLRNRCQFDDEDRDGSYNILKEVFLENLQNWCENRLLEGEQLERDLSFIAQEREKNLTELLSKISHLKTELLFQRNLLPSVILDLEKLESLVNELKSLFERGQVFRDELRKIAFQKDEDLLDEERQLLSAISTEGSSITFSQLRQRLQGDRDVWEVLKALYKKGHLEITLRRRE